MVAMAACPLLGSQTSPSQSLDEFLAFYGFQLTPQGSALINEGYMTGAKKRAVHYETQRVFSHSKNFGDWI